MQREKRGPAKIRDNPSDCRGFFTALHASLHVEDVLAAASEQIAGCFEFSGTDIHLIDPETGILRLATRFGMSPDFIQEVSFPAERGPVGSVLKTGKPLFLGAFPERPRPGGWTSDPEGPIAFAGAPVLDRGKTVGVISGYSDAPKPLSQADREWFVETAAEVGLALSNALAFEQAERKAHRYIGISRVITASRRLGTLDKVLQDIAKTLVQALGFDQSWIGLAEDRTRALVGKACFGAGMTLRCGSVTFPLDSGAGNPAIDAARLQKPVVSHDPAAVADEPFRLWLKRLRAQGLAFVPIVRADETLGVIGVFYLGDQQFHEDDLRTLASVAEQAANAVENAELYEKAKTSEERYRILFESAGTGLAILDESNTFRLVNHAFESLSGFSRDELVGKMSFFQFFGDKSQLPLLLEEGGVLQAKRELAFQDRHGNLKQVHILTDRIPGASDLLVSLVDMTRERELERRLFKTEELAAIGELSAGIAHEIRNPLVAITTSVSLLKDEAHLSSEGRQVLDVVKEETDHLAAIVDDFLKFARPKKPMFQAEDLNQLLHDVVRRHKDMGRTDVDWVEAYDDGLPEVHLDRHQIQQVITNLLLNSLDAMPNGGTVRVSTRLLGADGGGGFVDVTVSDSGVGISGEELSRIFQPFYSTKEKGTGMGLAICRRIVGEHEGEITVKSEPWKGSAFSVLLPLKPKNDIKNGWESDHVGYPSDR